MIGLACPSIYFSTITKVSARIIDTHIINTNCLKGLIQKDKKTIKETVKKTHSKDPISLILSKKGKNIFLLHKNTQIYLSNANIDTTPKISKIKAVM
jgi:glycerol-3-phosphate dehydrogenase